MHELFIFMGFGFRFSTVLAPTLPFFHHPSPEWVNIGIILELYQSGYLICFKTVDLSPIQPILFASQPNIELWYQPGTGHGRGGHD